MSEYNPRRRNATNVNTTFTMPTGHVHTLCQIPSATPIIPASAAVKSRQLTPCAASQAQKSFTSAQERPDALGAGQLHAIRRGVDRREGLARRSANFDVVHRAERRGVVVGPRIENILFGRARATGGNRSAT